MQPATPWPKELPSQQYFINYYRSNNENRAYQDQEEYLYWVQIFYQGSALAPGWLQLTNQLLEEVVESKKPGYAARMYALGQRVGAEWSLDNRVRRIDTRSASVWNEVLLEAKVLEDLDNFLQRFEADVADILADRLHKDDIAFTRYYADTAFEFL